MFKKLFSINYNNNLILEMLKGRQSGIIGSNIIAPLIIMATLYDYIPISILILWLFLHMILIFSKQHFSKKLLNSIKNNGNKIKRNLYYYIATISSTAFIFGMVSWLSIIYDIPDINIFLIGFIIIAMVSGAFSTIGTVYVSFVGFTLFSLVPFILVLLYHGGIVFNLLAILLIMYIIIHIISGYRLFLTYQRTFDLEKKFTTIFNKSSDGIAIIQNNTIIECNETLINMFNYNNEMNIFLDTKLSKLMPDTQPGGKSSIEKMLSMLKKSQITTTTFECVHRKKSSELFWTEITFSLIELNEQKIILGLWRDIGSRKEVEQKIKNINSTLKFKVKQEVEKNRIQDQYLIQQSKLAQMGEMISMIAHQWRQPLTAISATANNLSLKLMFDNIDKEDFRTEVQLIEDYSQHLSKTIDDFRGFFKENKELLVATLEDIVTSTLDIVKISAENKNIKIITEFNSNKKLKTYPNEVKQVVLNIIKNAEDILIENKIKNPIITIETIVKDYNNILIIKDNAGGIPENIIDKIFDPYFSTKKEKDGTGLGLYMSKTIIEEHCNGKLSVSNDENGAVFTIIFQENIQDKSC